jgi:DNA-nicking Smr family endonuclease
MIILVLRTMRMDFGDILNEWDRIKRDRQEEAPAKRAAALDVPVPPPAPVAVPVSVPSAALERWLEINGVRDKDAEAEGGPESRAALREMRGAAARRLDGLKCQETLDLHGMSAEEAKTALRGFIDASARAGLEKVLVIHGKGLHSEGAPVLKKATREVLETHPLAGRFGEAAKEEGGSGAVWVLIRSKDRE